MQEILIQSSLDGTMQPSLYRKSPSAEKRPLLVGLHTWSYDRFNQVSDLLPLAEEHDFNLILPEFRGANLEHNPIRTQACASELAMRDIRDAVDYAVADGADPAHVFLYGCSGGGHMALMMAAYCPAYFEAIAAFVPITHLKKWADYNAYYRPHILACCSENEAEMAKRSPISYVDEISRANVKIFHGKYDTSVPFTQSVELFNATLEKHPTAKVYLDIFDGGHDRDLDQAMYWFKSQYKNTTKDTVTG